MRVRMIEAHHLEAAPAPFTPGLDVVLRIDEESVRIASQIAGWNRLRDFARRAEQHAAAFSGRRVASVCDQLVQHTTGHTQLRIHNWESGIGIRGGFNSPSYVVSGFSRTSRRPPDRLRQGYGGPPKRDVFAVAREGGSRTLRTTGN